MTGILPKITFGIIVLNGEPFTRYNLRSLYPFAHQIIVVEGASPYAANVATPDGHSLDGTLEILHSFKQEEDPENKLLVVTAEDEHHSNGFWPGEKDEQSQAYAKRATGDWLWQIDIDEFYQESDMTLVEDLLVHDPSITAITFPEIPFWGSFDYCCDGILLRLEYSKFHRLFKWGDGYKLVTHRPPTVINSEGVNLRDIHWLNDEDMRASRVFLYHYTQIFPKQVSSKMAYYEEMIRQTNNRNRPVRNTKKWYKETFLSLHNPYRVHTVNKWPSWLVQFTGCHPSQIQKLKSDIDHGQIPMVMRDMYDASVLVRSRKYQIGIALLKVWTNYVVQTGRLGSSLLRRRVNFLQFLRGLWLIITYRQRIF